MNRYELIQRLAYSAKSDNRFKYFDKYKRHLLISRDEMMAIQSRYIQSLIKHAYNNTSFYKSLFFDNDINPERIKTKDDLQQLPPLTKGIIRKNLNKISSTDAFGKKLIEITSGGTTGEQGLIYASPYYIKNSAAFTLRSNLLAGWHPADKWVAIRTVMKSSDTKQEVRTQFRNIINRVTPLNALAYNEEFFDEWVFKVNRIKPKIIYGFSSVLLAFSKFLLQNNIHLPSIQIPISTSEILTERNIIEDAFRSKVVDQYGSREVMAIGLQVQNANSMIIFDDNVVVNESENNELIVTALHSYGFPLINYKLGDYGCLIDDKEYEANGLPFSQLGLKIGRITDNFISINKVHVAASSLITHLANFKLGVKEQQIVQNDYKNFTINYIPDTQLNVDFKKVIKNVFMEYFGKDIELRFNEVLYIPYEKSGKKLMYKRVFNP